MAHIFRLASKFTDTWGRELGPADHPKGTNHYLGGVLQAFEAGILEELGVEQHTQGRANVIVIVHQCVGQQINGFWVSWRGHRPCRDLGFVGNEEIIEVPGDELGRGRLPADDVNDVFAVVCGNLEMHLEKLKQQKREYGIKSDTLVFE